MKTALALGLLAHRQHDNILTGDNTIRIVFGILAVLVLLVVVVIGVGYALPVKHRATHAITLPTPPATIYTLITNPTAFPEWRPRVKRIEPVARPDGVMSYREIGDDGDILYVVDAAVPSKRVITRIADDKLPFGGTWTCELQSVDAGTQLRITEEGEVRNPVFRLMSRFFFGHYASIDTYLGDVARKFGQPATILP